MRVGAAKVVARVLVGAALVTVAACGSGSSYYLPEEPVDPFPAGSYWTTPLPDEAPRHPDSPAIIEFLRTTNARDGCVMLVGAGDNDWGNPVYWAQVTDPEYDVTSVKYEVPPEFGSLRIPSGAEPSRNSDAEMIVYDPARGYVAHLSKAAFDEAASAWEVSGGSIAYLDSNGIDGRLDGADDPRNLGSFRGYNGAVAVVRHDEVAAGAVGHVMKVAVADSADWAVWPMVNSDGDSTDPAAPPQGTRIRIRPDVDLGQYDLHPQALIVATALQEYGAIIGDSSGGPVALKLEDTVTEGRGQLWELAPDALCAVPIDAFEVIASEYHPGAADAGSD